MKTVSVDFARELIDYAPTERTRKLGFGESQLCGAVAAYNMLARNRVAYLADEVGMGKTYVALGVMGMLRHIHPDARVMIITPRENIQRKWVKELGNFVRGNWRVEDNAVRGLDGRPVHQPLVIDRLTALAGACRQSDTRDPVLRMGSFSVSVNSTEARRRLRRALRPMVPWARTRGLGSRDEGEFRDWVGRTLNAVLSDIDLLIVDEAHNLRKGFDPRGSTRNRILGHALGHPEGAHRDAPWYQPRVKRLLLLSATPFEYDYADIYRQLDVLGLGDAALADSQGSSRVAVSELANLDVDYITKQELVARMMIRRVTYLNIQNRKHTKNMYRREWRHGGYHDHDDPMALVDTKQRLVVGLMQKKVAEILGDKRFNNSYQIGMLSSFESFLETMTRRRRKTVQADGDDEPVFDGDQEATANERQGVDTDTLERVGLSYRARFDESLPHPKLDATANALFHAFHTGEKALVFVRRVATVRELKAKLDAVFDGWIRRRMDEELPELREEIDELFQRYRRERRGDQLQSSQHEGQNQVEEDLVEPLGDDEGGQDSFFAWFFRGEGPSDITSGAAFQKNRLSSASSEYSTFFEDDYVAWVLGNPANPLQALFDRLGGSPDHQRETLRALAFGYFCNLTTQRERYPRFYVFEAYQSAGLKLLADSGGPLASMALNVLRLRFELHQPKPTTLPEPFPGPEAGIGITTFFTELVNRPQLRRSLWPEETLRSMPEKFRRREWRRDLLSSMARLGASYIDLYLLAIRQIGSFGQRARREGGEASETLVQDFLDLLERQSHQPGFHAYRELSEAAKTFETLIAVNYPEVHQTSLSGLADVFGRSLQHQVPVGGMSGGVNKRMVRQFRMPGFPLVLVTTDVLQEGEDLHTFCRRVIHYGISWTPSGMEQRTGRVDRIGSLAQRSLDGRSELPDEDELIQVYFPHLADTVEVFQVRRVLERLNRFLQMVHEIRPEHRTDESRIDLTQEVLRDQDYPAPFKGLLESAFPIRDVDLDGELDSGAVIRVDVESLERLFSENWTRLERKFDIEADPPMSSRSRTGRVRLQSGRCALRGQAGDGEARWQQFELQLVAQVAGNATLIKCTSPVGYLELDSDNGLVDRLYDLQFEHGMVKVCARHDVKRRQYHVTIEGDRLFHLETSQPEETERLLRRTVKVADIIEGDLLHRDDATGAIHISEDENDG